MTARPRKIQFRVLAVDPGSRSLGYAVFEGPDLLVDWGIKNARRDKKRLNLAIVMALVSRFKPDVLVAEDCGHRSSRRSRRIRQLMKDMFLMVRKAGVKRCAVSLAAVRRHFATHDAKGKHAIAQAIAERFPGLASYLPRRRKAWQTQDPSMDIFDAVALALTFYGSP